MFRSRVCFTHFNHFCMVNINPSYPCILIVANHVSRIFVVSRYHVRKHNVHHTRGHQSWCCPLCVVDCTSANCIPFYHHQLIRSIHTRLHTNTQPPTPLPASTKQWQDAASLYEKAGHYEAAVSVYLRMKNYRRAGDLLSRVVNAPRLQLQYAKAREADGAYKEAVIAYEAARDWDSVVRWVMVFCLFVHSFIRSFACLFVCLYEWVSAAG